MVVAVVYFSLRDCGVSLHLLTLSVMSSVMFGFLRKDFPCL